VENVMHDSLETQAILQRLEEVRCDLDEDVQKIVEGARSMGDWRTYLRTYPWVSLGAALAVGYLIVPRRPVRMQPHAHSFAESANQSPLLATSRLPPKGNVRGMLLAFVGKLVMRGVSTYIGFQVNKLFSTPSARYQDDQHEEPHC
jgi:hypothetical protein